MGSIVVSDDDYRLEKRIEKIQEDSDLDQDTIEFIVEDYLNEVQRSGANQKNTQEIYIRRLAKILETESLSIQEIQALDETELKELNNEIVDHVQNSKYKSRSGEHSVRTKRGFYGSWKRMLEAIDLDTGEYQDYMPKNVSFSSERSKVDKKKVTTPEDLPNSDQVKQFLKTIGNISSEGTQLRNQALVGLIWDIGARAGEIIEDDELKTIKMKQVQVQGDRLHIKVKGNKNKSEKERQASDRHVEVFQCRRLLLDYIEQHPKRNDPEAFLFPPSKRNQHHDDETRFYTSTSKGPLRRKIHQTRRKAELDFKTKREPLHIFRKGMITYYVMNDILSWEKVCERTGKDPSSTMPTYLKMAMADINATAAEGFGLDSEVRETEHRMIGPALLPKNCRSCETENRCYRDTCSSCGTELPESKMPKGEDFEDTEPDFEEYDPEKLEEALETLEVLKQQGHI